MTIRYLLWKYRKHFIWICVLFLTLSIVSMVGPLFTSLLVDSVDARVPLRKIWTILGVLIGANCVQFLLNYIQTLIVGNLSIELSTYLRDCVTRGFLSMSINSPLKGQYVTTALADVTSVTTFITNNLISILTYLGTFIGMSIVLSKNSPILYCSIVAVIPLYAIAYRFFASKKYKVSQRMRELQGTLTRTITEIEHNHWSIVHHGGTGKVIRFFQNNMATFNHGVKTQIRLHANSGIIMSALSFFVTLLSLGLGGYLVYMNKLSLGEYIAFLSYGSRLVSPIVGMTGVGLAWQSFRVALDRINCMIQEAKRLAETVYLAEAPVCVTFLNARPFAHSSFVINGEIKLMGRVSIIGDTGSGKSTICEMLTGKLWSVDGSVIFAPEPYSHSSTTVKRRPIILVSSQMKLFSSMSVYENLMIGADDELGTNIPSVHHYLEIVEMDERVSAIDCLNEPVSKFGFSTGEEQRLLLARALLLNPGVLILDEALSGVEADMFTRIIGRISDIVPVIVTISHRSCDHEGADRVYHVKCGTIVCEKC